VMRTEGRLQRVRELVFRDAAGDQLMQSAEDEVLLGIEHGRLGEALTRLSPELRAAMQATVLDGLTCAEAGRLLGVPAGTIKSRCHRARMELREALT
jgi:RNA polymerase sigma-70 factor, ECF subfamily